MFTTFSGYKHSREKFLAEAINKKYDSPLFPPILANNIALASGFGISLQDLADTQVAVLDKGSKSIYLTSNAELLDRWENFAIAHVLGRLLLGHSSFSFASTMLYSSVDTKTAEANRFASYLLMPDAFLHEYEWLEEDFAQIFRVPQEVVQLRMSLAIS